ncbi:DUF4352 domain-containing protein, partial [Nonomuraea lactucae]|uniref:DUF4352 domain-containing protein n=1 Tax=Nonomuraea lactucae TaxID=2249762 RepID=UPI001965F0C9
AERTGPVPPTHRAAQPPPGPGPLPGPAPSQALPPNPPPNAPQSPPQGAPHGPPQLPAQSPPHHQTGQGPLPSPAGHHTGQGPLPPSGMYARPRPGRNVFAGCLTAAVIGTVLLVLLLALMAWVSRVPPAVGAESPVNDGRLRFAVTGSACPKAANSAAHRTCRVAVRVENVGGEARVLYPGQQKLFDEDDTLHPGTRLLDKEGTEITPIRIGPGDSFSGTLVFELPKSVRPAGVELHDSGLSKGVRVTFG